MNRPGVYAALPACPAPRGGRALRAVRPLALTVALLAAMVCAEARAQDSCGDIPSKDITEKIYDQSQYVGTFYLQDREVTQNLIAICAELNKLSVENHADLAAIADIDKDLQLIRDQLEKLARDRPEPRPPWPPASSPQFILNAHDLLSEDQQLLSQMVDKLSKIQQSPASPVAVVMPDQDGGDKDRQVKRQIDPLMPVSRYFPDAAQIEFLVATVPDPRVPRLRRKYDETIVAISDGMLKNGFVIDRYGFPWAQSLEDELQQEGEAKVGNGSPQAAGPDPAALADDGRFGVLLFRKDGFRAPRGPGKAPPGWGKAAVRAVYLIPETGSYGVATNSFQCAVRRIESQIAEPEEGSVPRKALLSCIQQVEQAELDANRQYLDTGSGSGDTRLEDKPEPPDQKTSAADQVAAAKMAALEEKRKAIERVYFAPEQAAGTDPPIALGLASLPMCDKPDGQDKDRTGNGPLLVLGPSFSGSINSLAAAAVAAKGTVRETPTNKFEVCVVGTATTVDTNRQINDLSGLSGWFSYSTLAVDDGSKLNELARLRKAMHISAERTAFFFEASTFGYSAYDSFHCGSKSPKGLAEFCDGPQIFFPANIADVRYGEQKKREERQAGEKEQMLPPDKHLSLQNGAENGSEYPESQQSPLTAVSNELELEQVLEALGRSGARLVVVAATDVRDRLFLFDKIRSVLPDALLVDLETDSLLAHPEFIHASRGALVLSSASVQPFEDLPANHPCDPIARAWASDAQKLLAYAVRDIGPDPKEKCRVLPTDTPILHAVTRQGLKPLWSRRGAGAEGCAALFLAAALWAGLLAVCVGIVALWSAGPWIIGNRGLRLIPISLKSVDELLRTDSDTYLLNIYLLSTLAVSVLVAFGNFPGWTVAFGVFMVFCWLLQGRLASYLRAVEGNGIRHVRWTCLRRKRRYPPRLSTSGRARWWSLSCSGVAIVLVGAALSQLFGWGGPALRIDRNALAALGMSLNSGLAFHFSLALAVLVLIYSGAALRTVIESNSRNRGVVVAALRGARRGAAATRLIRFYDRYLTGTWEFYAMGAAATAFMVLSSTFDLDSVGGLFGLGRVTPFGPVATWAVFLAELMTTMVGIVWLIGAVYVGQRINLLASFILRGMPDPKAPPRPVAAAEKADAESVEAAPAAGGEKKEGDGAQNRDAPGGEQDGGDSEFPGLWKKFDPAVPITFPATAMAAGVMEGGKDVSDFFKRSRMIEWKQRLREVFSGEEDTTLRRHAILALLSTEIVQFRWAGLNALLCAFAGVGQVYLFPVFRGDSFLLFNLALMFIVGLVIALGAVMFEGNAVLSNIVCNSSRKGKLSRSLVGIVAQPFVLLLIATALSNVPGVRDWSDGALQPLLKLFPGLGGGGE